MSKSRDRRLQLVELFGNKCYDCSVVHPDYVYEFHHNIPKEKSFTIGGHNLCRKWEIVLKEATKCDMVCANCHKIRHGKLRRHGND